MGPLSCTGFYTEPAAKGNKMQMSPLCSSSSPPCTTTTTSPPWYHHKERRRGRLGAPTTFATPPPLPSRLSLKGTDQMASELLNVQQLIASPDASLLHPPTTHAPLNSDILYRLLRETRYIAASSDFKVSAQQPCGDFGPFG